MDVLKKIMKFIVVVPLYIFLILEGFILGGSTPGNTESADVWNDLMKWVNK